MSFTGRENLDRPDDVYSDIELIQDSATETADERSAILPGNRNARTPRRKGFCEKYCACCSPPKTNAADRPSSCACNWLSIFNTLVLISICVYLYIQFKQTVQKYSEIDQRLDAMQKYNEEKFNTLEWTVQHWKEAEQNFETDTNRAMQKTAQDISAIDKTLEYQEYQLNRLLQNGTSNADVLDRLKETRQEVKMRLQKEHEEVFAVVQASTRNVTMRLEQNSREIAATQQHVDESLQQTVVYMQEVVGTASTHIRQVQENVTSEMDATTKKVENMVHKLGDKVRAAEDTIHNEVEAVQKNIEQYVAVTDKQFAAENDFVKYQLAGTFTLLGCLISLWHLTSHLRHYYKPDVQRRIMAVLWMVPIYSITSWLSLVFPHWEPLLGAIRDLYEAYAIYTFIALLIAIIEDGRGLTGMINQLAQRVVEEREAVAEYERLVAERAPRSSFLYFFSGSSRGADAEPLSRLPPRPVEHIHPPCPCCYRTHRPTTVAAAWLYQCQLMAAQFVIMRPLLTCVPLILRHTGVYDLDSVPVFANGAVNWLAPNLYVLFAQNLSVGIAFYGLLSFYHGTEKELEWCDPWPKFLCIKGVVFCTFWQSLTIQMLSAMGRVDARSASQIQNLLICIEMLLASLAHFYIFPYEEWKDGYKREREKGIMLRDTLALRDFVKDMTRMVTTWDTDDRAEMEALSTEKAKLTSELHHVLSQASHGSRSNSIATSPVGPLSQPVVNHPGDIENGAMYDGDGGWRTYSYDDPGDGQEQRRHSGERERLITFQPHNVGRSVSYGSNAQVWKNDVAGRNNKSTNNLSSSSHDRSGSPRSPERGEGLRSALLKKLNQLAPSAGNSPVPGSGNPVVISQHPDYARGVSRSSSRDHQVSPRGRLNSGLQPDIISKTSSTESYTFGRGARADGPHSSLHTDSLTYSPESSMSNLDLQLGLMSVLSSQGDASRRPSLGPTGFKQQRGLFMDPDQFAQAGMIPFDVSDASSVDSDSTSRSYIGKVFPAPSSNLVEHPAAQYPMEGLSQGGIASAAADNYFDSALSSLQNSQSYSRHASNTSVLSETGGGAFRNVPSPLPDHSPLPEKGLGTWSAVKGSAQDDSDDSDQSVYAI